VEVKSDRFLATVNGAFLFVWLRAPLLDLTDRLKYYVELDLNRKIPPLGVHEALWLGMTVS
jgi:hypothetical protein